MNPRALFLRPRPMGVLPVSGVEMTQESALTLRRATVHAKAFYERLGFVVAETTTERYFMEWSP